MRPNKTNFGLSFGHFGSKNVKKRGEEKKKSRKREEEEEEEEERYGTRILYGIICVWTLGPLSMESMFGCYDFVWI